MLTTSKKKEVKNNGFAVTHWRSLSDFRDFKFNEVLYNKTKKKLIINISNLKFVSTHVCTYFAYAIRRNKKLLQHIPGVRRAIKDVSRHKTRP